MTKEAPLGPPGFSPHAVQLHWPAAESAPHLQGRRAPWPEDDKKGANENLGFGLQIECVCDRWVEEYHSITENGMPNGSISRESHRKNAKRLKVSAVIRWQAVPSSAKSRRLASSALIPVRPGQWGPSAPLSYWLKLCLREENRRICG